MINDESKRWLSEYDAFLNSKEEPISRALYDMTFLTMNGLLNPSPWRVFFKILGVHAAIGFLSLSVCHQFGMNPFGTVWSLDTWIMSLWGHNTCMIACGVFFVSFSFFSAGFLLTVEEVRALKRTEFLQSFLLGGISMITFASIGAEFVLTFAGLWFLGALIGGILATETLWQLKRCIN
jgi:hypothetical protein